MLQNLKIDIIYYNTPSDFEFEFNLGGYCRNARILNARTSSAKETVGALAKAVNRSRIIIMIGQLNDDDGLISYVSKAISRKVVLINNAEYNIASDDNYYVCDGALPLVTKGGAFGGCIVESGPQSIIMLSSNKSLRNEIMQQLVYTYLVSISRTPDDENNLIDSSATAKAEDIIPAPQEQEKDVISIPDESCQAFEEVIETQNTEITEETQNTQDQEALEDFSADNKEDNGLNEEIALDIEENESSEIIEMEPSQPITTEPVAEFFTTTDSFNQFEDSDDLEDDGIIQADEADYVEDEFVTTDAFDDADADADIIKQENTQYEAEQNETINSYEDIYSGISYEIDDDTTESKKEAENKTKTPKGLKNAMLIIAALLLIVCALLTYFIVYVPMSNDVSVVTYLKEIFNL